VGSPVLLTALTVLVLLTSLVPMRKRRRALRAGTTAAKNRAEGSDEKRGQVRRKRGPARVWTSFLLSF